MNTAERVRKLQLKMASLACDALLIDDPTNLFYLTGLKLSAGKLIVTPNSNLLGVDGRYIEAAREQSSCPTSLFTPEHGIFHHLEPTVKSLGFLTDLTTYKSFLDLKKQADEKGVQLIPVENPLRQLRAIKDPDEVRLLEQAAALGSEGYDFILKNLKEGITEAALAFELEFFWKKRGGESFAFDPIIAFGPNTSKPHYRAGNTKLKKGDPVLIDIGVVRQGYNSDMTRTIFFGEPSPKLLEIYTIVHEAQEAALTLCKPGTPLGDLDDAARNLIKKRGFGDAFSHSLGHGIGLEVHEFPILRRTSPQANLPLETNMAITIEPGIYLPGIGGVRIEDLVIITATGYVNLTKRSTGLTIC